MAKNQKKAQEEIVGFVVIVVVVSIILLIFLGLMVSSKKKIEDKKSETLTNYLSALEEFTSNCTMYSGNYLRIRELFEQCNTNKLCASGEKACEILNKTLISIFNSTRPFGENFTRKGYIFNVSSSTKDIFFISRGSCPSNYEVADDFILSGRITFYLKECY
jgi:hypothetical protein